MTRFLRKQSLRHRRCVQLKDVVSTSRIQKENPFGVTKMVQLMVKSGKQAYPYDFRLFQKEQTESKIELSKELLATIPMFEQPTYLLCDSWYTSRKLVEAALSRGTHVIGALKINRIIYPAGVHMQVKQFATYLDEQDTDLVMVVQEQYRVYRYEGTLNDIESGFAVLCWPANQPLEAKQMRCFLSTDIELSTQMILDYYSERWAIETYFKQVKGTPGFQSVQVRHRRAFKRSWLLVKFSYLFISEPQQAPFTVAIHQMRKEQFAGIIEFVYNETQLGTPLAQIKNELLAA